MANFLDALYRANQNTNGIVDKALAAFPAKLTSRQYVVLHTIGAAPGINQITLVEKTGIDRSTLSEIVRRLAKKGLVQRKRSTSDLRAYSLRILRKGASALADAQGPYEDISAKIVATMPAQDLKTTMRALAHLAELSHE